MKSHFQSITINAMIALSVVFLPLGATAANNGFASLAIKFAPDQNYNHSFINLNWTTPATKQSAGVLNTTNWINWIPSGSVPYSTNGMFYDLNGLTNGNLSTATIRDWHSTEDVNYYNGSWPASSGRLAGSEIKPTDSGEKKLLDNRPGKC